MRFYSAEVVTQKYVRNVAKFLIDFSSYFFNFMNLHNIFL